MRNTPPEEYVLVSEKGEVEFLAECLRRSGADGDTAQTTSQLLTNCDLRSIRSHGINRAPGYCRDLKEGRLNPDPAVRQVEDAAAAVVFDGDGGLGYVPMVRATEAAITKAVGGGGIGLGVARRIGHYGAAGHYTRMCADRGCIGFSVQGGRGQAPAQGAGAEMPLADKPSVAFTGAPAMSFAMPGRDGDHVVLDMVAHALSEYRGEEFDDLPGRVPGAFFKSVGLVATASLLGGALSGRMLPDAERAAEQWARATHGGTVVAIDPAAVGVPREAFAEEVAGYARRIREGYSPLPGFDEVLMPGEKEARSEVLCRREGIRFGEREQEAAREMSEYLDVPVPWHSGA